MHWEQLDPVPAGGGNAVTSPPRSQEQLRRGLESEGMQKMSCSDPGGNRAMPGRALPPQLPMFTIPSPSTAGAGSHKGSSLFQGLIPFPRALGEAGQPPCAVREQLPPPAAIDTFPPQTLHPGATLPHFPGFQRQIPSFHQESRREQPLWRQSKAPAACVSVCVHPGGSPVQ